jgi:glycerophosphoryl diester phosphodiesterase
MKIYINQLRNNFKNLVLFELFYKLIFLVFVYPIIKYIFNLSIYYIELDYLRNQTLFFYLTKPSTIIMIVFILLILTLYTSFEIICLSVLLSIESKSDFNIKLFIKNSFLKYIDFIKNKRFIFLIFLSLFVLLIEIYHIVGVGNFVFIPLDLSRFVFSNVLFSILLILVFISLTYLVLNEVKKMISKQRGLRYQKSKIKKTMIELMLLFLLNATLNIVFYILYDGSFLLLDFLINNITLSSFFKTVLFGITSSLSIIYIIIATTILLPLNIILINSFIIYEPLYTETKITVKSKRFRYLLLSLFILSLLSFQFFALDFELRNDIASHDVLVVAHRGYSSKAPENTMSAIELAVLNQAKGIEFDVRLTKDLVPVLLHDETMGRTTNDVNNRRLKDLTLFEVKQLDAGSWFDSSFSSEKIPTLAEVIFRIKELNDENQFNGLLFIELKDNDIALDQQVINLITSQSLVTQTHLLSFSYDQILRIKNINPSIKTTLLVSSFYGDPFHLIHLEGVDHFGLSMNFIDNNYDLINILHELNKKVYVWTVDEEKNIKKFADLNVNGIITNEVEIANQTLVNHQYPTIETIILKKYYMRKNRLLDIE